MLLACTFSRRSDDPRWRNFAQCNILSIHGKYTDPELNRKLQGVYAGFDEVSDEGPWVIRPRAQSLRRYQRTAVDIQ